MKKKIITTIGIIIASLFLSAVVEVFIYNFHSVFNHAQSQTNLSYSISKYDHKTTYKISIDNTYINKLIINYHTAKDIDYIIRYETTTSFDQKKETVIEDIFDDAFSKSVTNINQDVSELSIEFQTADTETIDIFSIDIDNEFHFNKSRFIFIFLTCILICSLIYFFKDGFKSEKIHIYFAIVSILLGSMIIIAQPASTYYSYDDQIHFQNAFDFPWPNSQYLVGEYSASDVPNSAGRDSINSIEEQHAQNSFFNTTFDSINRPRSTFSYNKIIYAPMSIGYHLARSLNLTFSLSFRIGKFIGLLTYDILLAYAIKTIKIGKKLLTIISLLPTSLFLASEYSYDPIVFSGISVFMAHLINLFLDKKQKFTYKTALIMIISITCASLAKSIYAPLIFLALFIPKNRFSTPKISRLFKINVSLIGLLLLSNFILPVLTGSVGGDTRNIGTSTSGQISSIIKHPFDYVKLLANSIFGELGDRLFNNIRFASYIPTLPNANSTNFIYIFNFLIFFFYLIDNKSNRLTIKQRTLLFSFISMIIILIYTALYLSFTTVGSDVIAGVQNRYFLPLLFPLLLCLQPTKIKSQIKPKIVNGIAIVTPTIILFIYIYFSVLVPYAF